MEVYLNNHKVIIILFHASVHDAAILNFAGIFQSNEREVTIYFVVLYSLSGETNTLKFIIYNSLLFTEREFIQGRMVKEANPRAGMYVGILLELTNGYGCAPTFVLGLVVSQSGVFSVVLIDDKKDVILGSDGCKC